MDNIRLILIFSLAAVSLLIYQAWLQDYGPATTARQVATTEKPAAAPGGSNGIPGLQSDAPKPPSSVLPLAASQTTTDSGQLITVQTDLMKVEISTKGGTIASAWLTDYAVAPESPDVKLRLLKPDTPNMFVVQSGLIGSASDALPTHEALFTSDSSQYALEPGQTSLTVPLFWTSPDGVQVRKNLRFQRGSYVVESTQEVLNNSAQPLIAREYAQLQRTELIDPNASRFVSTYTGGVYYTPEDKYTKISFDQMREQKLDRSVTDGWVAMIQHYFMSALIPPRGISETFYTNVLDGSRYIIGKYSPPVVVNAGASHTFTNQVYIGPKLPSTLAAVAPGLELTVDFGWLTVIAQPIHWLLDMIYTIVGNWGWAIVVLTILIKLAFYKLSEASYKSMAKMRQITPRMQALKDRYGDDKERLNQAMMEMYKTEKINPLGGCLPILVQIPVFIALYWVLLESVELRQAPFILWIDNLSAPDPYFVLPLIMGISMFVQSKLNPAPPDPIQAKVMMSLPFVFTIFFAFFPAGLVLYWTVNNLLSIAQQWHITRNIDKEAAKRNR